MTDDQLTKAAEAIAFSTPWDGSMPDPRAIAGILREHGLGPSNILPAEERPAFTGPEPDEQDIELAELRAQALRDELVQMVALSRLHADLAEGGMVPEVRWSDLATKLNTVLEAYDVWVGEHP